MSSLHYPRQSLDELLGLCGAVVDPDEYDNYGYADASALELRGQDQRIVLTSCRVLAMHRSDDQSAAAPGRLDLEFETPAGPAWVDLEAFVRAKLVPLAKTPGQTLVMALCNSDSLDLRAQLQELWRTHTVYWAHGDVQASYEDPSAPRVLRAQRWFCAGPGPSTT